MAIQNINGGPNGDTVAVGFHKTNANFEDVQKQVDAIPKYEIASTSEAETGIDDTKVMTAKKVRAAIKAQGGGVGGAKHVHIKARNVYEFTAPSDTNTITLPAEIFTPGGDYINLYMYGVKLDENEHYVLNGNVITLEFTLKAGEPIDYEIYKTTFSWNDLVHKPDFASNAEALAGTNNDTIMTPLRVKEALTPTINEVSSLKQVVNNKPTNWKNESALPSSYPKGVSVFYDYRGDSKWNGYSYVTIRTTKEDNNSTFQEVLDAHRGKILYYRGCASTSDAWGEWQTVATTKVFNNVPLLNGWVLNDWRENKLVKTGVAVTGTFSIKGGNVAYGTTVAQLPPELRPNGNRDCMGVCYDGTTWHPCLVYIQGDGIVGAYSIPSNINVLIHVNYTI